MISANANYLAAAANNPKKPIFIITISDYFRVLSNVVIPGTFIATPMFDWLVSVEDLSVTVSDLDGGSDLADLVFTVQDRDGQITADFPVFVFEGKTVQLLVGYEGLVFADYITLFTGKIDSVESTNNNLEYVFTCPDARADLSQTIYQLGDDGFSTSDTHPRTLLGHPLDILIAALEVECGYDSSQVDEAKIIAFRDGVYSGASMQFALTSAPTAKDFIEAEIMKPLGAYLRTNNLGQITVEFAYPVSSSTVFDFTPDNLIGIPSAGQADLINQVLTRMDSNGNDFTVESVQSYQASIDKYGLLGQQIIESKGFRSGLNGVFLSSVTAFLLFLRYGMKALCHGDNGKNSASDPINALWSAALVEPGDFVTLSHPLIPDRVAGILGIEDKTYVVMDRTWQFFQGNVQFKLIEIDLSKFKQYLIAGPLVADYIGAIYDVSSVQVIHATAGDILGWIVLVTLTTTPTGLTVANRSGFGGTLITFAGLTHATWLNGQTLGLIEQVGAVLGFRPVTGTPEPYGPTSDTGTATPPGASGTDQDTYMFLCNDGGTYSNGALALTLA